VHAAGEVKAKAVEAETEVTRNSQVSDAALLSATDNAKSVMKTASPGIVVTSTETPPSAMADVSDHRSSDNGLQSASCDAGSAALNSDRVPPASRGSEDARETTERSEGGNVSCVRDLINEAIEKTLQDPLEQCQSLTPSPSLGGQFYCFTPFITRP